MNIRVGTGPGSSSSSGDTDSGTLNNSLSLSKLSKLEENSLG